MKSIIKTGKRGIIAILTLCILLGNAGTCLNVTATAEETVVAVEATMAVTEENAVAIEEITATTEANVPELMPMMASGCPSNQITFNTRSQAFNEAKRQLGLPTSAQPERITLNYDRRGNVVPGHIYYFSGGSFIRDDCSGHTFLDGDSLGAHFNISSSDLHIFYLE